MTVCSCQTTTSTALVDDSCTCGTTTETVIDPVTVKPVTASEEASNKYSVQTEIKSRNGSGTQKNTRAGTATGENNTELTASMHAELVDITVEIIRSIIGDTYTSSAFDGIITSGTPDPILASLTDLNTFQGYFIAGGTTDLPAASTPLTPTQSAQVNYIAQVMYPVFLSIQKHIGGASGDIIVCTSGNSRVFQVSIKNCLFCLKFIYN